VPEAEVLQAAALLRQRLLVLPDGDDLLLVGLFGSRRNLLRSPGFVLQHRRNLLLGSGCIVLLGSGRDLLRTPADLLRSGCVVLLCVVLLRWRSFGLNQVGSTSARIIDRVPAARICRRVPGSFLMRTAGLVRESVRPGPARRQDLEEFDSEGSFWNLAARPCFEPRHVNRTVRVERDSVPTVHAWRRTVS